MWLCTPPLPLAFFRYHRQLRRALSALMRFTLQTHYTAISVALINVMIISFDVNASRCSPLLARLKALLVYNFKLTNSFDAFTSCHGNNESKAARQDVSS